MWHSGSLFGPVPDSEAFSVPTGWTLGSSARDPVHVCPVGPSARGDQSLVTGSQSTSFCCVLLIGLCTSLFYFEVEFPHLHPKIKQSQKEIISHTNSRQVEMTRYAPRPTRCLAPHHSLLSQWCGAAPSFTFSSFSTS